MRCGGDGWGDAVDRAFFRLLAGRKTKARVGEGGFQTGPERADVFFRQHPCARNFRQHRLNAKRGGRLNQVALQGLVQHLADDRLGAVGGGVADVIAGLLDQCDNLGAADVGEASGAEAWQYDHWQQPILIGQCPRPFAPNGVVCVSLGQGLKRLVLGLLLGQDRRLL
jgi:hypothetical protein